MNVHEFHLNESHRRDLTELLIQLSGQERVLRLENLSHAHCIGAFDGERLVGFAQLYILPKTTFTIGHLEDVVVHSDFRAQGLGRRIMEEVISVAKGENCLVINLTTRPERESAQALYESMGFVYPGNHVMRLSLPANEAA